MKAMYEVMDKNGAHLCYQVATSEEDAVYTAKAHYGHKRAHHAKRVGEA